MNRATKWTAAAAALGVVLLVLGWVLVVSPARSGADETAAKAAAQQSANASQRATIAALQAAQANLPEQKAQIAALEVKIPADPSVATLVRQVSALAAATGVSLLSLTPAAPQPYQGAAPAAAPAAAAPAEAEGGSQPASPPTEAGPITAPPGVAGARVAGLSSMDVSLQVGGSFPKVRNFFAGLENLPRAFLVNGWTIGRGAAGGATAPTAGALTAQIQGTVFMSAGATS